MIDTQALANELQQARAARMAAEAAWNDVEELLWEVQRGPRMWRRLALVDAGELDVCAPMEPAPVAAATALAA